MRSSEGLLALLAVVLGAQGCFSSVDLTGRRCPCDRGWTCDELRDRCVPGDGIDASVDAGRDAGRDAPGLDAPGPDAPARDAPAGDVPAAMPDVPVDAPPAFVVCPVGAALCDDFESEDLDRMPPWSWASGESRSTVRAFGGVGSGHFEIPGGTAVLEHQVGLDVSGPVDDVYLRFWAYVPSTAAPQNVAIAVLSDNTAPGYENHSLIVTDAGWGMYDTIDASFFGVEPFPDDTWTCVVFHAELGTPGLLELLIDGATPVTGVADTRFTPGLGVLAVGITYVDPSQLMPFDIFFDDVTVTLDGTPLVCP